MESDLQPPGVNKRDGTRRYWTLISYSHREPAWGARVHRAIETYRVPRRLVGKKSLFGWAIPRRIFPVFRDTEELPSAADLGKNIIEALCNSHTLIVICSPNAAASRWVNEEVRQYKKLGREGRILGLIIDGEPHASMRPHTGRPECFPPALRVRIGADGELTDEPAEPLAADVRPGEGVKWKIARLKLIAGVIGVPFDELRRRERERVVRRAFQAALLVLVAAAALFALRWQTQREARLVEAHQMIAQAERHIANRHLLHAGQALLAAVERGIPPREVAELIRSASRALVSQVDVLPFDGRRIETLAYSPDGNLLCAAGDDGRVWLWDTSKRPALLYKRQRFSHRTVAAATFQPGKAAVWAALWDGNLGIWNYDLSADVQLLSGHYRKIRVNSLDFDPPGDRLVSGGDDTFVKVWQTAGQQPAGNDLLEHDDLVKSVRFSPDGTLVVSAGFDGKVKVIHLVDRRLVKELKVRDKLNRALITRDNEKVICGGLAGTIRIMSASSGRAIRTIDRAHDGRLNELALHPDGTSLFTAADDGYVRRWRLEDGSLMQSIERHGEFQPDPESRTVNILSIALSPDGRYIATGGDDGLVRIWDLNAWPTSTEPVVLLQRLRTYLVEIH